MQIGQIVMFLKYSFIVMNRELLCMSLHISHSLIHSLNELKIELPLCKRIHFYYAIDFFFYEKYVY